MVSRPTPARPEKRRTTRSSRSSPSRTSASRGNSMMICSIRSGFDTV
jgi:hypothetical protein